jgi:putative DNA primase/helicase
MHGPEDYIRRGWHIFPVFGFNRGRCTCGKSHQNDNQAGKHPITQNGVKAATTDLETIRSWARSYQDCNWAVACGRISNLLVVDIDPRKDGFASFGKYEDNRPDGPLPDTLKALSGGGGRHLFFEYPTDGVPVSNKVNWLPGVDIRSDGGYIILPYSTHVSGGRYSWINDEVADPLPAPRDLLSDIRQSMSSPTTRDYAIDASSILQGVPEGRRDHTLFLAACSLRRKLGDDQRAAVEIIIKAAAANSDPPFPEADAMRKVEQAWKMNHTDEDYDWGFINSKGDMFHHLTDKGNKERFIEKLAEDLRHVEGWGWVQYSSTGWIRCGDIMPLHVAEGVASIVREEIPHIDDTAQKTAWKRHALKSESSGSISAVVNLAKNDPRLNLKVSEFDTDPYIIGCSNGIVDLRTGEIRGFTRDDFMTKNTNVVYDPTFSLPQWEAFLSESTGCDDTLIRYLQMAAGYTLTGSTAEECFFVLSGPTASGKSTFVDALIAMCGGYGLTTQSETFMYRRNQQTAKNELARLVGMRLVAMSEVREGEVFDEAIVKQFTGGDRVSARFLYQDTFEFTPQMKLWIATNHDPAAREKAMMRRIKRILFPHTVPPERRDSRLKSMLKDPDLGGRAVLAWAVRGAMAYLDAGRLLEPLQVRMAVAEYEQENDTFSHFINEHIVREPSGITDLQTAYDAYRFWCQSTNEYAVKRPQFKKRMEDEGFPVVKDNSRTVIYNCVIKLVGVYGA